MCDMGHVQALHFVVVEVDFFNGEITHFNAIWFHEDSEIRFALKVPFPFHAANVMVSLVADDDDDMNGTHDPSFFPIGSSYSTPTHTPFAKSVGPTNRTVPRLRKSSSVDSTSQRPPTGILVTSGSSGSSSVAFSAKRPILLRCLYASTVSGEVLA